MNLAAASLFTGCKKNKTKKNGTTVYSSINPPTSVEWQNLERKKKKGREKETAWEREMQGKEEKDD